MMKIRISSLWSLAHAAPIAIELLKHDTSRSYLNKRENTSNNQIVSALYIQLDIISQKAKKCSTLKSLMILPNTHLIRAHSYREINMWRPNDFAYLNCVPIII